MKQVKFIWTTLLLALIPGLATATYAQDSTSLTVTENGVGSINKTTPFNLKTVRALFPKFQVKKEAWMIESEERAPVLLVSDQKHRLFVIYGWERILSIEIVSNRVPSSTGVKVGTLFSQIYPTGKPEGCEIRLYGQIGCPAPNLKNVAYIFAERGKKGFSHFGDDGVPPLKNLRRGTLKAIEWKAISEN